MQHMHMGGGGVKESTHIGAFLILRSVGAELCMHNLKKIQAACTKHCLHIMYYRSKSPKQPPCEHSKMLKCKYIKLYMHFALCTWIMTSFCWYNSIFSFIDIMLSLLSQSSKLSTSPMTEARKTRLGNQNSLKCMPGGPVLRGNHLRKVRFPKRKSVQQAVL
jgi:hypothetical protein